ncbi:hypothetical protein DFH29DRAFT_873933 [Suillus ampliporus]|nr:hypothetical protein DFH29DRAFT_873933 [Suillus ampliporus]
MHSSEQPFHFLNAHASQSPYPVVIGFANQPPVSFFDNDQIPDSDFLDTLHAGQSWQYPTLTGSGNQPEPSAPFPNDQFPDANFHDVHTGGQPPATSFTNHSLSDPQLFLDAQAGHMSRDHYHSTVTGTGEELPVSSVNDQFHSTTFDQQMDHHNAYGGSLQVQLPPQDMSYPAIAPWLDHWFSYLPTAIPDAASASLHYSPPLPPYLHSLSLPVLSIDGLSSMPAGFDDVPPLRFGEPLLPPEGLLLPPPRK